MTEPVKTEEPTIGLVDLQNALRIIDAAAERGAFRGNELSSVGTVRDKIASFLAHALPPEAPAEEAPADEVAEPAPKAPARKGRAK